MNNEFKKIKNNEDTRYVLENASSGGTSSGSVASVSMPIGSTRKRGDNILAQEADKKTVPVSTPRNFVAKNAKTGGAGQHKDKKKAEKQGDVKHRKPFAEQGVAEAFPNPGSGSTGSSKEDKRIAAALRKKHIPTTPNDKKKGVAEALDSNFVGFMNKTLGQKADAPTDKSPMPDFMKGAPVAGLDSMGYKAALDFGMKTLRKLTPTQKTKLSIKGEDGVVNWLANQAKKQGLLITDESDEDTQGKFMQEDLDEVQDFLPEVFHDPAIKSWAFVLTDGEPLPKAPVAGPFKVGINPGITGQNGYANADWKTVDTLENLPDARDLAQGLSQKNPKQFVAIWAANGKSAGFYWPGEGWRGIDEGVAEGGEKYKVKSIGHDAKGDYYISPSTGKKVYKSGVKVGDHENPKTGEHKGVAEDMSRRGFLRGAGALAVGSALAGGASADNQTDPNKLIAIVNINGESKEFNLTGRFKGDAKSQLHQAEEFITEFLENRDINFSNLELRYQGTVLKTQNIGSVKEEQGVAENMDHNKDNQAVEELKAALIARKQRLQSATDDQVYDSIDKIMTRIAKTHSISGQKLHDMWVDKYHEVPDTWIMNENFADGKKPGRKGLAKRVGVNCKQPVSKLRSIAANSSGERQRMAHWCANMKSGKKK